MRLYRAPMYSTWTVYSMICVSGWIFSAIFHTRDIPTTEKLDYFCAFAIVLSSFYVLCIRAIGDGNDHIKRSLGAASLAFYIHHIWHLSRRNFDYGYNMKVNVTIGIANLLGWLVFCYMRR